VDAAFLVVAGKHPSGLAPEYHPLVEAGQRPGLGFRSAGHASWHDDNRRVAFGAWQLPPVSPQETAWQIDPDQVVMAVGWLRWRNQGWPPATQRAAQLARATRRAPLRDVAGQLRGVFALVWMNADGHVAVATDPLGLRCVYYGENDDVVAVSSKAALVAEALAIGRPAPRDVLHTCWLAFTTHWIGNATGFECVRVLPAGAAIGLGPAGVISIEGGGSWIPDQEMRGLDCYELVELVRDDIAETLRATLDLPVDRHVVRLTGGKDSRLILAVALWAGLAQDFDYETIGPETLADVRIASELAEKLSLRHEVKFLGLAPSRPYSDRAHDFVATTGGMLNIWDLSEPDTPPNEVRIVGLCGEMLRTYRSVKTPVSSTDDLVGLFKRRNFGRLGLLGADVAQRLHQLMLAALLDDPSSSLEPLDLMDAFYMRNRTRLTRIGPQEELVGQRRIMPLYSIGTLRAAYALGGAGRQAELLHHEVMRRCSSELLTHPFAGPGWHPKAVTTPSDPGTPDAGRADVTPPVPSDHAKSESLMQSLQSAGFADRKAFLRGVLAARENPVWALVQRDRAEAALDRFESLTLPERRELYGAVTAAMWLGDEVRR
jgi:hypothetical protein